jgi:serine/threonine-protein kinase
MFSGQAPFTGETGLSLAFQHLHKEPRPLESLCPHLPVALCRVVHKMLAKSLPQRYSSPRELLADLEKVQAHLRGGDASVEAPIAETGEAEAPSESLEELSQRVSKVIRQVSRGRTTAARWILGIAWAVGILGALAGGFWAGWQARQHPGLLADTPPPGIMIPQQESALRQWFYAAQLNTEEAWQSVLEYFPEKPYLVFRAKQQLARIYLREGRYAEAMKIFEECALLGEPESEMQAYGLAGQCSIYTLQGQYREAAALLVQLWPIRHQLKDRQMQQLLGHVVQKIRSELGRATAQEWETWLREKFSQQE